MATVTLVANTFKVLANFERKSLGMPLLPLGIVPYPMTDASVPEAQRRAMAIIDDVINGLTVQPESAQGSGKGGLVAEVKLDDTSLEGVNAAFYAKRWTDGMVIVPPTRTRVEAMLAYTDLAPETELGRMGPSWQPTTVHHAAVNAVMAGCKPEYFPVVIAGLQAMLDPALNLYGVQGTTNPAGVMLLVNGPIAKELDINGGFNVFGQGWHANGTIGRAARLCMINIGGGRPGEGDMSTLGNPNKWGACIAENEVQSPWPPFQVERGFAATTSTVTAVATAAPMNVVSMAPEGEAVARGLAQALTAQGSNNQIFDNQPMVVVSPLQANRLHAAGFDKPKLRAYLYEHGRFSVDDMFPVDQRVIREWKQRCVRVVDGKEWIYPTRTPEDIGIAVAGGDSGPHSAILATFNGTSLVTKAIARADGAPVASVQDLKRK